MKNTQHPDVDVHANYPPPTASSDPRDGDDPLLSPERTVSNGSTTSNNGRYRDDPDAPPENGSSTSDAPSRPGQGETVDPFELEPSGDDETGYSYNNGKEIGDMAAYGPAEADGPLTFPWTVLPPNFVEWLYPSHLPTPVSLLRRENIAVPACYLCVGLLQGLSGPLINVYPLDLNATEAQQATISSLRGLPSTFKLAFGFWSDNVPLWGYRRKSYMFIGWMMASLSMIALILTSDLTLSKETETNDDGDEVEITVAPENAPSIPGFSLAVLLFGTGFWFADVMGDSIVAEKAKLEPPESRGQLQSTCYACRFFGLMVAAPISTVLYSKYSPGLVIAIMAALPVAMLPLIYNLWERKDAPVKPTREQCGEIWTTVCSRAVWQPMGFVFLYNLLQIGNAAWREFLKTVLGFTANQLNTLLIVAYVLLYAGVMAYKYYFIKWTWRAVYIVTTMLNGVFSALQVLLIQGITFGISPFLFALGDDAFADFISGIQFLPTTIMMVHLCPTGSEGASYAMFTTVNNSALGLSSAISTVMLGIWDVSKETMASGDVSGMTKLTVLTTALQVSGVLFVGLLPKTKEDLVRLHSDGLSGSKIGGFIFLSITLLSVLYAIVVGILNIVKPGWAGES
mmetsp:Transcript_11040/g.23319  ORF Transcript_11040/g.23319 Transcript_11040/m.23319 type:complete len:626 (-) Transcript_11040:168-2045(-)